MWHDPCGDLGPGMSYWILDGQRVGKRLRVGDGLAEIAAVMIERHPALGGNGHENPMYADKFWEYIDYELGYRDLCACVDFSDVQPLSRAEIIDATFYHPRARAFQQWVREWMDSREHRPWAWHALDAALAAQQRGKVHVRAATCRTLRSYWKM